MPRAVIVGEPTGLEVVDAHKSVVTFITTVHGFEAHSSKPDLGANAVMAAAELVAELDRIADEMMARGDPSGRFDPPYTTVHVGTIAGGTARNILAKTAASTGSSAACRASIRTRSRRARALRRRRSCCKRLNRFGAFGRIETDARGRGAGPRARSGLGGGDAGAAARRPQEPHHTVPFATEAGHFQAAGIPTIVCGPGSIDQAHQPDEYITLEQLAAGEAFMRGLRRIAPAADAVILGRSPHRRARARFPEMADPRLRMTRSRSQL